MPEDKNLNSEPKIEPKLEKPITDQEKISVSETEKQEKIDQGLEKISQKEEKIIEKIQEGGDGDERMGATGIMPVSVLQKHKEREKKIEEVLAQDLDEFYLSMGEEKRMEFKVVGEKTARTINTMIETGKVHAKKIIELIRKWLSIVPGINKFFVEQQAKIKTDKIMQIKKE
ncbi:hypothetical protein A2331_04165 [Candidatus Falkowbacteria bacterium RIFOXYB2_FULL_34_18]|uniref:Uncharacterized protein n=1 Tax=Candidatus Falkowbacteria bacterium RIFOXYD2_FULL_34_120 TaxID=1798007 RepID=A0A1F5TSC1_9BACT|nr:MAG: hypothetical protein A2331_04165 [Candidatus Falkowbacteria bacterium RIFOXYB2_FULL_34_18]OGF29712.1 MAG: hypothetical protein A2500_00360 [Candidatus Falkowbacteria bacterium RIFOXYC12_FULL_34_55]OGF37423.1 MAG: hypothetical protein A2466_00360 [Candidatus Falkowbacteria bacterium RIFOXYC2_FULL_34_220]OGF39148.1 MAG: hypothetical protein A2515_00315 [Candidatus Falkowbacteria bacterium RIFOXYD12_FULL_34_57]OGF41697.1 MAG: hypothetical protein A2531_06035 [Candidatus Falkowbacteria bact